VKKDRKIQLNTIFDAYNVRQLVILKSAILIERINLYGVTSE